MNPLGGQSRNADIAEAQALLRAGSSRLVSIFGSIDDDGVRRVHYILDVDSREYRLFSQRVEAAIPSVTRITPAAAWYERELHDLYGVEIDGHPNLQPLVFHEGWPPESRPHCSRVGIPEMPSYEYRFLKVQGGGVCEVPVGPVHAGIIEPGHFRFSVVGDTVLHLELRHFYTHKGTEALFEGAPAMGGVMLAESVSGDNCFAHAVAYCQAIENAFGVSVPPRGRALRLVGLELERMLAHIGDVGALCCDVACVVPPAYTARLKESMLQASTRYLGTRCWRGLAIPGGIKCDLAQEDARALGKIVTEAARDFAELAEMILQTPSVQNRFESTGTLKRGLARALGVVGLAARASGLRLDVRRDHPYGRYRTLALEVPQYSSGDVLARARVRIDEAAISARLITAALDNLPTGAITTSVPSQNSAEGFSAVESPRGELLYWMRIRDGFIRRCHIKSPSFQNWPALPLAMPDNIIADFPLINKSFNLSYSGCDR
jgi:Ni,Fe-hydrogenase III large subunit/Ni,Fe-hydrogenase III component G